MYDAPIAIADPVRYVTPYGGRLIWTLPCGNNLILHLKDKKKIRNKKRFSQVCISNVTSDTPSID